MALPKPKAGRSRPTVRRKSTVPKSFSSKTTPPNRTSKRATRSRNVSPMPNPTAPTSSPTHSPPIRSNSTSSAPSPSSKLSKKTAACFPPTSPGSPNSANSCATENPPITPHKPSKTLRKPLENPPKTPRFSSHLIPRISRSQPAQLFYLPSFQSLNRYFSKTPLASK